MDFDFGEFMVRTLLSVPLVLIEITGVVLALVKRKSLGKAITILAVAGFIWLLLGAVVGTGGKAWRDASMTDGHSPETYVTGTEILIETLLRSFCETIGYICLIAAAFKTIRSTQPE